MKLPLDVGPQQAWYHQGSLRRIGLRRHPLDLPVKYLELAVDGQLPLGKVHVGLQQGQYLALAQPHNYSTPVERFARVALDELEQSCDLRGFERLHLLLRPFRNSATVSIFLLRSWPRSICLFSSLSFWMTSAL